MLQYRNSKECGDRERLSSWDRDYGEWERKYMLKKIIYIVMSVWQRESCNRFLEKKNFESEVYRGRSVMRLFFSWAQKGSQFVLYPPIDWINKAFLLLINTSFQSF
jgi:hypothetical protein